MLLYIGSAVLLGLGSVTAVVTLQASRALRQIGIAQTQATATVFAERAARPLNEAMLVARTLAQSLAALHANEPSRRTADAMLRQTLADNPQLLGVWTAWEPNAFDGHDHDFIGKPGHDATGRYVPYWHRANDQISVEPNKDYTVVGAGDYYLLPKKTGQETVMEPYLYKVGDHEVLMTSFVAPIRNAAGEFIGVAGVDIALQAMSEEIARNKVGVPFCQTF